MWRNDLANIRLPSTAQEAFVLPVKLAVRKAEGLSAGAAATFVVTVLS